VFDGFSPDNHRVGHSIEPVLHGFEDSFMLPALQALCLFRCATRPESAGVASDQITIMNDIIVIAAIGNDGDLVDPHGLFGAQAIGTS
jgi:hypothetical protein